MLRFFILSALISSSLASCQLSETINQPELTEMYPLVLPDDYTDQVGDTLRIMSWNVEHFVDSYDNPYVDNPRENAPDSSQLNQRMQLLADAIRQVNPDVVVLQEFESEQLARMIADSLLVDLNYNYFADAESPDWYMNVIVMSRAPLGLSIGYGNIYSPLEYEDEAGQTQKETQRQINTRLFTTEVIPREDFRFLLSGVHLKAGRGPRNEAMRMGQLEMMAQQLKRISLGTGIERQLIVGDFNAYPDSEEINFITGEAGLNFIDPLPAEVDTHPADAPSRRLDYILINEQMMQYYVDESIQVRYLYDTAQQAAASDHLPLVADFVIARDL
ncbi:MAG: endonuclease/exonuclease/phosphatase family protein [Cyclobacteriaceae bacterium]